MTVEPNISMLQFMPAAFGLGPIGMNEKMKTKLRKIMDAMLIGRPALPKLNLEGSSGSPRIRLSVMHEIDTI